MTAWWWVSLTLVGLAAAAPLEPIVSEPLTAAYQPTVSLPLVRDGVPAVLLVPDHPEFAALADELAEGLKAALGIAPPRAPEQGFKADGRAIIVYGNCFTGPLTRRLYANHLLLADGFRPGAGYELRTIPDALDLGASVLFLGGSTPDGVRAALAALRPRLKPGREVRVDHFTDLRSSLVARPAPPDQAAIERAGQALEATLGSFRSNKLEGALGQVENAALSYLLTGDDAFGRLYARLLRPTVAYYREKHEGPPTFHLASYVMSLDQIEESAGLTDPDRLLAADWLREFVEDTMRFWEMREPIKRYRAQVSQPTWNHETYPSLGIGLAAQYLGTHYRLPAAVWWSAVVDWLFGCQVAVDQPLEDSANYQWHVHAHTADYVLATGRHPEFLAGDGFRKHLDYAIASHDNLGDEATHGDAWQAFGSIAAEVFTIGAAVYRDPAYSFMLKLIGANPDRMWGYGGTAAAPQPPADHAGLKVFTVHPERVAAYGIEGVPADRALDKAVFRSGWGRDDEYLMLDGLNVGNHKHLDANAIIRYVARRRLWLADMDYIRSAPKHHNTLVVTRDGLSPDQRPAGRGDAQVIAAPPYVAELEQAAGGAKLALTSSTLRDYAGADWRRSIFFAAGNGLVVIDELTARQPGRYVTRCVWRTLGEVAVEGPRVHVRQRGCQVAGNDHLRLVTDDGREVVELTSRAARITFAVEAPAGPAVLRVVAKGRDGGSDSFWLGIDDQPPYNVSLSTEAYPSADTGGLPFTFTTGGRHTFTLTMREAPGEKLAAIVVVPEKGPETRLTAAELVADQIQRIDEPEQHFFVCNGDGSNLRLDDQLDYGHGGAKGYYADYPFAGRTTRVISQLQRRELAAGQKLVYGNLLHTAEGDQAFGRELRRLGEQAWIAGGARPILVTTAPWRAEGLVLEAAATVLTADGLAAAGARRVELAGKPVSGTGTVEAKFDPATSAAVAKRLTELFATAPAAPEPATVHPLTVPGFKVTKVFRRPAAVTALTSGEGGFVVGQADGKLCALTAAGVERWSHDAGSRVRCLAPCGQAGWIVGTEAGDVILLGPDGARRWTYRCEPFHGRSGAVATVAAADFDGDGRPEVLAGSENWHYHGLTGKGKLLWRADCTHAATVCAVADLTGDGKDDFVGGSEYYSIRLFDSAGKRIGAVGGGPVASAAAAADVDGDKLAEGLVGMEDCFVYALKMGGGPLWQANVGGTPTAIAVLPGEAGPAIAVGTDGYGVVLLDARGTRTAYVPLPGAVADLKRVGQRLAAACADGSVYLLSAAGDVLGACTLPAPPERLAKLDDRHAVAAAGPWLALFSVEDDIERTRSGG